MKRTLITIFIILAAVVVGLVFNSRINVEVKGEIVVAPDSLNSLRVDLAFELNQAANVVVKYWKDKTDVFYSELSPLSKHHAIRLIALQELKEYNYILMFSNDKGESESDQFKFKTDKKSRYLTPIEWLKPPNNSYSGYILTQRRLVNGSIYLLDNEGEIVWYNNVPQQPKLSNWTQNNTILVMYGNANHRNSAGDYIIEYDLNGKVHLNINLNDVKNPIEVHHEVRYDQNQNLLMLAYDKKVVDLSRIGGESKQEVMADAIVLLDKKGNELWRWSVFDYADPINDESILENTKDWSHANALSIDRDGNYLVSLRNWNQVWKVDSDTGDVIWKLGEHGNIKMPEDSYFSGQHAFHVNAKGEYMMFDNGRDIRKTRVLSFDIDESNKMADVKMNIPLPDEFYADRMGSAYLIENDNVLICTPRTNSIIVIDSIGTVLSHAKLGLPDPYRAEYVPSLYPAQYGQ